MKAISVVVLVLNSAVGTLTGQADAQSLDAPWLDTPEAPAETWIDIERDYGCKSIDEAPNFDNAPLLNQCFQDAGRQHFARIYIPGKSYRIDDTVTIPDRTAIAVVGTGITLFQAHQQFHPPETGGPLPLGGPASRLVWFGPPGKPMVEYNGYGLFWQGVSLFGRYAEKNWRKPTGERATVGLLVRKPHGAIGTGKLCVTQMSVAECDTGVQFGVNEGDQNADTGVFGFFLAHNCDTGIRVCHHMGMGFMVQTYWQFWTKTAFRFDCGGRLHCRSLGLMNPGTVLSLGKPRIGGASYHIDGLIIDNIATTGDGFKLVTMDEPAPAMITMSGHLPHAPYTGPIALLKGHASLLLRDVYGLRQGAVVCRSATVNVTRQGQRLKESVSPHVRLDGCRLFDAANPENVIAGLGQERRGYISWSGCCSQLAAPIEDGSFDHSNRANQ